jgi:hypothetical protein
MKFFSKCRHVLLMISLILLVVCLNRAIPDTCGQNTSTPIQENKKSTEARQDSTFIPSLSDEEIPLIPPQVEIKLRRRTSSNGWLPTGLLEWEKDSSSRWDTG